MRSFLRMQFLALTLGALVAPSLAAQDGGPRLVIMLVIDQLRGDLLDRYEPAFTGGFRRLLDEGFRFTQSSHAHARTEHGSGSRDAHHRGLSLSPRGRRELLVPAGRW